MVKRLSRAKRKKSPNKDAARASTSMIKKKGGRRQEMIEKEKQKYGGQNRGLMIKKKREGRRTCIVFQEKIRRRRTRELKQRAPFGREKETNGALTERKGGRQSKKKRCQTLSVLQRCNANDG